MNGPYRTVVRLLDADPDLSEGLPAEARRRATEALRTRVATLPPGPWDPPDIGGAAMGLLVLDGLMVRRIRLGRSSSTELLGPGDVLRPGESLPPPLWPDAAEWRILEETEVAVLDARITVALGRYPELTVAMCERFLRRSQSLGYLMAAQHFTRVADRLLVSLWHMASLWGRVTPEGTVVPFRLTHEMLAEIIGARRPTTTQAVIALERQGLLRRDEQRCFVLLGDPAQVGPAQPIESQGVAPAAGGVATGVAPAAGS